MNPSKIAILGTGYVGLVAGACFAENGREVTCIDNDEAKIEALKTGQIPFYEPGLADLVTKNWKNGRLRFTIDTAEAMRDNDILFIAVGTPTGEDGSTDLSQIESAVEAVGRGLDREMLIVFKSTVPVGTTLHMKERLQSASTASLHVAFNPEFLRQGSAVNDFMNPDRTIIGVEDQSVAELLEELYMSFVSPQAPLIVCDIASAEMTKYAANSMLATKISFINDFANLCQSVGADIEVVRHGIGFDKRIGTQFLNPGIGFGGSCFPKDLKSVVHVAGEQGEPMPLLRAVLEINQRMRSQFVKTVENHFGSLEGRTLAMWGLSFKPNSDDLREAPSVDIVRMLLEKGAKVRAYDPKAMERARQVIGEGIVYCKDAYGACEDADAVLLVTEWSEFRTPDWGRLAELLKSPVFFDGRNIFKPENMIRRGFTYYSIGRPPRLAESSRNLSSVDFKKGKD